MSACLTRQSVDKGPVKRAHCNGGARKRLLLATLAKRLLLATLAAFLAADSGLEAQQPRDTTVFKRRTMYEDLQMLTGVLNQIRVNHPDTIDAHELISAAIEGMVRAADPHSYVITAQRLDPAKEKALREGRAHPVPLTFAFIGSSPVVLSVVPGSSAAKADVLPGDELVAIDGAPVPARSADELDILLTGPKGSPVRMTFERRRSDGSLVQLERTIRRERTDEGSAVPAAFLLDPRTGYVRLTTFMGDRVADDLHGALRRLEQQGMQRLVLDLRGNGGGRLDQAAVVAGEFLPKGTLVYTAEGRKRDVTDTGRVSRSFWSREKRYPIVVMIDRGSASASELVAGALQDHDRALIVGRTSFGKSLLMAPQFLPDGSFMSLVVGHIRTPCGRVIQRSYRNLTTREYVRQAGVDADTLGRPSCRTTGGRTVYGGGGIYPDIHLGQRRMVPVWLSRVREEALPIKWVAGHVSEAGTAYSSLAALAGARQLAGGGIADFRKFAAEQRVVIPEGAEADRLLEELLVPLVAESKWGAEGYYRLVAVLDPEVGQGVAAFAQAEAVLRAGDAEVVR